MYQRKSKILPSDAKNLKLDGVDELMASMIVISLKDLYTEIPKITHSKVSLVWLYLEYYPNVRRIKLHRKEANEFFNDENSLFNKYYNLNKEYIIEHYGERYNKTKTQEDKY